ncbi:MAG: PadR family transcriptional regulator [Longimicrobiales bacterium]
MVEPQAALTPLAFEILLALASGEQHGYAIMREVEERSGGSVRAHAGTLYRAIARLVESGWIEELDAGADAGDDERRRYYRLSALGRRVASSEAQRLAAQVQAARRRNLLERPGLS